MPLKKRKPKNPVNITRDEIEKAMREYKGEIQHLRIEKDTFEKPSQKESEQETIQPRQHPWLKAYF